MVLVTSGARSDRLSDTDAFGADAGTRSTFSGDADWCLRANDALEILRFAGKSGISPAASGSTRQLLAFVICLGRSTWFPLELPLAFGQLAEASQNSLLAK
jgi:hypothetical protein